MDNNKKSPPVASFKVKEVTAPKGTFGTDVITVWPSKFPGKYRVQTNADALKKWLLNPGAYYADVAIRSEQESDGSTVTASEKKASELISQITKEFGGL